MSEKSKANSNNGLRNFLSYLAFEGHSIRIGLLLSSCIFFFNLLAILFSTLGLSSGGGQLLAWFLSCGAIAIIDQALFGSSGKILKETYKLEQNGNYKEAEELLKTISPDSSSSVPCPAYLYHSRMAEIAISGANYSLASSSIDKLENDQEFTTTKQLLTLKLLEAEKGPELAREHLESLDSTDPLIKFEKALLLLKSKAPRPEITKALDAVMQEEEFLHPCGIYLHSLANAYREANRLWTGHAEEAIEELGICILVLQRSATICPGVKEHLANLYVERAYYLATHAEPSKAQMDLSIAKAFSHFKYVAQRITECEEELLWRYDIEPTELKKPIDIGSASKPQEQEAVSETTEQTFDA